MDLFRACNFIPFASLHAARIHDLQAIACVVVVLGTGRTAVMDVGRLRALCCTADNMLCEFKVVVFCACEYVRITTMQVTLPDDERGKMLRQSLCARFVVMIVTAVLILLLCLKLDGEAHYTAAIIGLFKPDSACNSFWCSTFFSRHYVLFSHFFHFLVVYSWILGAPFFIFSGCYFCCCCLMCCGTVSGDAGSTATRAETDGSAAEKTPLTTSSVSPLADSV